MLNSQPISKPENSPDGLLSVHSIFPTIQGEGPFVGMPAVFVRLGGCNLQCQLCDTEYTNGAEIQSPAELLDKVRLACHSKETRLVVITGGEPLRQNIVPFIKELQKRSYLVQVETNGTIYREEFCDKDLKTFTIVCSPKARIHPALMPHIQAYKYVMEFGWVDERDGLPTRVLGSYGIIGRPPLGFPKEHVYIQPCDEGEPTKNAAHLKAALSSCFKFGYRICIQTHKILGLP
jgi:7-carboxy-7-deazaguanine synthase